MKGPIPQDGPDTQMPATSPVLLTELLEPEPHSAQSPGEQSASSLSLLQRIPKERSERPVRKNTQGEVQKGPQSRNLCPVKLGVCSCSPTRTSENPPLWGFYGGFITWARWMKSLATEDQFNLRSPPSPEVG